MQKQMLIHVFITSVNLKKKTSYNINLKFINSNMSYLHAESVNSTLLKKKSNLNLDVPVIEK